MKREELFYVQRLTTEIAQLEAVYRAAARILRAFDDETISNDSVLDMIDRDLRRLVEIMENAVD